jgi:hypothetical protein
MLLYPTDGVGSTGPGEPIAADERPIAADGLGSAAGGAGRWGWWPCARGICTSLGARGVACRLHTGRLHTGAGLR